MPLVGEESYVYIEFYLWRKTLSIESFIFAPMRPHYDIANGDLRQRSASDLKFKQLECVYFWTRPAHTVIMIPRREVVAAAAAALINIQVTRNLLVVGSNSR